MPSRPTVAERLRELLAKRQMDALALALAIRVAPRTMTNWTSGKTEPRADAIARMCDELKVSADYLIGRVDVESGLTPGFVLVDDDLVAKAERDPWHDYDPAIPIPRRTRVLSPDDWKKEEERIHKARRDAKGK